MGRVKEQLGDQQDESTKPLTQEELLRWWPFTRLDPKRFPKTKKTEHDEYEDALL
jgi:hypothetical protein